MRQAQRIELFQTVNDKGRIVYGDGEAGSERVETVL